MICSSCDDSFSPGGPEVRKMVVYSVLTSNSNVQYVRVYCNYFLEVSNPLNNIVDNPVKDATVTISNGLTTHIFRDTLVTPIDYFYFFENPYTFPRVIPQVSFCPSRNTGREVFRREVPEILKVISCFFEIYDYIYQRLHGERIPQISTWNFVGRNISFFLLTVAPLNL